MPFHFPCSSAQALAAIVGTAALLMACRKDHVDNPPVIICPSLSQILVQGDTVEAVYAQSNGIDVYIALEDSFLVRLICSGQDVAPTPSVAWDASNSIVVSPLDSVGLIRSATDWPCSYRSFSPGDTLSPYAELERSSVLYYVNWLGGGPCGEEYSTWYIGFVQIINGEKHAGVIQVGYLTWDAPYGKRYWIEKVVRADCPGAPFIVP